MINRVNNISFGAKISNIPWMSCITKEKKLLPNIKMNGYTAIIGADVYTPTNRISKHNLLFKDKTLVAIDEFEPNIHDTIQYVILNNKTITPAILDEHIHGGYGISFHDSNETEIRDLLKRLGEEGTSGVLATTLPGKFSDIKAQIKLLNNIIKHPDEGAAKIFGIHLEGPFLNPEKSGIHPPEILSEPTIENFLQLEPENIRMVTLAPELDKGYNLSKYLKDKGIIVSAGHSLASAEDVINSGATQVTHIFNAMAPFHHRIPSIANAGLLNPKITAEMNTDMSLLKPEIMDMIMKLKPKDKLVFISDALPNAGIKKDFDMNGVRIHVFDNWEAKSDDGILAGSMQFLHNIAKGIIEKTKMTFRDFVRYASVNPSKNLKVQDEFMLKEGLKPNFTVWDNVTVTPEKTFIS